MMIDTIKETVSDFGGGSIDSAADTEDLRAMQARAVGPSSVAYSIGSARSGEDWIKHIYVSSMPGKIPPGLIDVVNTHPRTSVEPVIHFSPTDSRSQITNLEKARKNLKVKLVKQKKNDDLEANTTRRKIAEHAYIHEQLKTDAQKLFDVGVYIRVRGESEETVDSEAEDLIAELDKKNIQARTIDYQSDKALTTTSPVVKDEFGGTTGKMLGDAVGAMFPFSASTLYEPNGILFGYHAVTDEPFQFDRFNREGGYNVFTIGALGMGKSFGTQLLLLRRMAMDPDTVLVMIDPVNGFNELARELDAERVPLGGEISLNPLEIQPTPLDVVREQELNPFGQWHSTSMGWCESYFSYIGSSVGGEDAGLNRQEQVVLGTALRKAAYINGVTEDPTTHGEPSPTLRQLREVLGKMATDVQKFLDESPSGQIQTTEKVRNTDKWEEIADELHMAMRPFLDGVFAGLGGSSNFDLDAKSTYIDAQQGGTDREKALRLQAPFNAVYQRAQASDKRMIIAIDEIHRLFDTPNSLEWLEMLIRHSRHFDISLHMITQQARDFFNHPRAETLAGLCTHKIIHKEPDLHYEPYGKKLGLTESEAKFGRVMQAGDPDRGYAHALVDVEDHGTYPIKVKPLPEELLKLDPDLSMDNPGAIANA